MIFDKLVSVIIPTYSRADNLNKAIESVLKQTYTNFEIIIVDDNGLGTPNQLITQEQVSQFLQDERIKYVTRLTNGGGSEARNTGIEESSGELITFLDDDDVYLQDKISYQVKIINSGYDISLCSMLVKLSTGIILDPKWCYSKGDSIRDFVLHGNAFTPMIMLKRNLLGENAKFIKVKMLQDHIFILNVLKNNPNAKINSSEKKLFVHHIHDGERVSNNRDVDCYRFKNSLENEFIPYLDKKEVSYLKFKQSKEIAIVMSECGDYVKSICFLIKNCTMISSFLFPKEYLKLILRIMVGRKIYHSLKRVL